MAVRRRLQGRNGIIWPLFLLSLAGNILLSSQSFWLFGVYFVHFFLSENWEKYYFFSKLVGLLKKGNGNNNGNFCPTSFVCLFVTGVSHLGLMPKQKRGVTLGWVFSCPSLWQTPKCLADCSTWHGKSTSVLNFSKALPMQLTCVSLTRP